MYRIRGLANSLCLAGGLFTLTSNELVGAFPNHDPIYMTCEEGDFKHLPEAGKWYCPKPYLLSFVKAEPPPEYRSARQVLAEGDLCSQYLEVIIDEEGNVVCGRNVFPGQKELTRAALAAVKQWKFYPVINRHGQPIKVRYRVHVKFKEGCSPIGP